MNPEEPDYAMRAIHAFPKITGFRWKVSCSSPRVNVVSVVGGTHSRSWNSGTKPPRPSNEAWNRLCLRRISFSLIHRRRKAIARHGQHVQRSQATRISPGPNIRFPSRSIVLSNAKLYFPTYPLRNNLGTNNIGESTGCQLRFARLPHSLHNRGISRIKGVDTIQRVQSVTGVLSSTINLHAFS